MAAAFSGELASLGFWAGRALLAAIFLHAGLQKLRHRAEWPGVVGNYRILPAAWIPAFSFILPWAEIVLAAALCLGPPVTAALWAGAMLLIFSTAVAINLARGRAHIDCGCFQSALRQTLSGRLLLRNAVLLGIAAVIATFDATIPMALPVKIVGASFGGVCFVLYLALNQLWVQGLPVPALPSLKAAPT